MTNTISRLSFRRPGSTAPGVARQSAGAGQPAETGPPAQLRSRLELAGLLLGTAVLYLWNLGASGWANAFSASSSALYVSSPLFVVYLPAAVRTNAERAPL